MNKKYVFLGFLCLAGLALYVNGDDVVLENIEPIYENDKFNAYDAPDSSEKSHYRPHEFDAFIEVHQNEKISASTQEGSVILEKNNPKIQSLQTPPTREELQEHFDKRLEDFDFIFDSESVDGSWARSTEFKLGSFVENWPGVKVSGMECRSSVCRASIDLGTHDDAESFVEGFARPPLDGRMHLIPLDPKNELTVAFYYERPE